MRHAEGRSEDAHQERRARERERETGEREAAARLRLEKRQRATERAEDQRYHHEDRILPERREGHPHRRHREQRHEREANEARDIGKYADAARVRDDHGLGRERLERFGEVGRRLVTSGGVARHGPRDDRCERLGDVDAERGRRRADCRAHDRHGVVPVVRRLSREQVIEDGADREHVGALVDLCDARGGLLGRHVGRRAEQRSRDGGVLRAGGRAERGVDGLDALADLAPHLRDPPVEQHRLAVLAEHDVVGFHVAVDDAVLVGKRERVRQPHDGRQQRHAIAHRPRRRHAGGQGLAAHEAHRVEGRAVLADAALVDRRNARVLEVAGDDGLDGEAVQQPLRSHAGQQLFHRDGAAELPIFGHDDPPHPALAEEGQRGEATLSRG